MVVVGFDGLAASGTSSRKERRTARGRAGVPRLTARHARPYAADFGLRPRRATATPGIAPAQLSQRSAAFAPRLASVNVMRITAPFPSLTSLPQVSQTSTVFRATRILSDRCSRAMRGRANRGRIRSRFYSIIVVPASDSERRRLITRIAAMDSRTIVVLEGDQTGQELLEESLRRAAPGRDRDRARAAAVRPLARESARNAERGRPRGGTRDPHPRARPQGGDGDPRGHRAMSARRTGSCARRSAAR